MSDSNSSSAQTTSTTTTTNETDMRVVGGDGSRNISAQGSTVDDHSMSISNTSNVTTDFGSVAGGLQVAAHSIDAIVAANAGAVGAVQASSAQSMGFASDALHQTTLAFHDMQGLTADMMRGALTAQTHAFDDAQTQISGAYQEATAQLKDAYETTHAGDQRDLSKMGMMVIGVVAVVGAAVAFKSRGH